MNQEIIVEEKMNQKPLSCTIAFSSGRTKSGCTGIGAVLFDETTRQLTVYYKGMGYLGETKSDEKPAFEALVMGMQIAKDRGFKNVKAVGNSTDLQNKYGKPWKIADTDKEVRDLCVKAMEIQKNFDSFTICVVPKEDNQLAYDYAEEAATFSVSEKLREKRL